MDESAKFCEHGVNVELGCPTCRVADYPRLKEQLASLEQQVRELTEKLEAPGIIDVKHIERIRVLETALWSLIEKWKLVRPKIDGMCTLGAIHGMPYQGPTIGEEFAAAEALLTPVEESGKEPSK